MTDFEELERLLAVIQEDGRRLPWELWTSCSYRRIKTAYSAEADCDLPHVQRLGGKDVLSGYRCDDGVVDLSMPEDRLFALVDLLNALPALLAETRKLREALETILHCTPANTNFYDCGDPFEIARAALNERSKP